MTLPQKLKEIKERAEEATPGPGIVGHCPVNDDSEKKIIEAFAHAVKASREHDPLSQFWFIETNDNLTVAYFGNGPTSEANATLWAASRTDIPRLVKALERAVEMIEDAIGLDGRSMGWEEEDEHKKRYLKELAEILEGR